MSRPKIPPDTQNRILYQSAWHCCVCRKRRGVQIHHIDQDPANNVDENLAIICLECHDEAHTKHALSQNLTAERIRDHKRRWEEDVQEGRSSGMVPEFVPGPAVWTYINHERFFAVLSGYGVDFDRRELQPFIDGKIVNAHGIPLRVIEPENGPDEPVTIYDRIPFECRAHLMAIYSEAITRLILAANPVDFRELKSSDQVEALAQPGTLCFLHRGCKFRARTTRPDGSEIRLVHSSIAGVTVRFQIDTRLMFGSSAFSNSFAGSRHTTALLFAKSLQIEGEETFLDCTPLAMGTGFLNRRSPWPGPDHGA